VATRVAAYHGGADVLIPEEAVTAFIAEMESAGADYDLVRLPGALHGFSNPQATINGEKYGFPLKYNALADAASWAHMQLVLREALA
jgi:dienelactone hydrolase